MKLDIPRQQPIVEKDGRPTRDMEIVMQEMAREIRDLKNRVAALETP